MTRWLFILATLTGLLALSACAAKEEAPSPGPTSAAALPSEWEQLLAAAKREGKVVVAGPGGTDITRVLTEPFERRYGIPVQYEPLGGPRGTELVERLRTERGAGQYLWDVFIGGTTTMITGMKPEGMLDPIEPALVLPEVKDPKSWRRGLEFVDKDHLGLVMTPYSIEAFMVNPTLAKPEEFKSYKDLLDPKWRGKIMAHDPRIAGSGQAVFSFLWQQKELGPEFLRALARQDVVPLRDVRQELDWLGQGKYSICLGCSPSTAEPLIKQGVPIAIIHPDQMKEGGYVTSGNGNVGLISKAAHPNAAKVYVNWLLTKEGQTGFSEVQGYLSGRVDVLVDPALSWRLPREGYWPSHSEEAVLETKAKAVPFFKEIFGE